MLPVSGMSRTCDVSSTYQKHVSIMLEVSKCNGGCSDLMSASPAGVMENCRPTEPALKDFH